MHFRLALGVSAIFAVLGLPSAALAVPGDRAISNPAPGVFRLDDGNLEPGCFVPGRGPVDLDTHLDLTTLSEGDIARELHVTVDSNSPINVDQVLVPSTIDGYKVYNTFENTGRAADIGPNFTAVDLFAPDSNGQGGPDGIDVRDVIVCVSDHGAAQNEPYSQEDDGLVSAKNRPILAPKVTGLGASAVGPLNTYKIGFGYDTERWYEAPEYDGANTFPFHPTVTDPEAFPSPTFGGDLPRLVRLVPRANDFDYDARRVNDVDGASELWYGPDLEGDVDGFGQDAWFRQDGDDHDWIAGDPLGGTPLNLIATLAQGDLPITWTLRPSLGAPDTEREVTFTDDDLRDWNKSWQDFYDCKGPKPEMPLLPGTNSPPSDDGQDCNPQQSVPAPTPAVPNPAPVVNPTPVTVNVPASDALKACQSNRKIKFTWAKNAKAGKLLYQGKVVIAKRSNGRLRATATLNAKKVAPGVYVKVVQKTKNGHGWTSKNKQFKVC
jgi:hypothetical protein